MVSSKVQIVPHCRYFTVDHFKDKKDFFKATKYDIEYDKMMEKYVL